MNQLNDSLRISKTPLVIQHVMIETITPYPAFVPSTSLTLRPSSEFTSRWRRGPTMCWEVAATVLRRSAASRSILEAVHQVHADLLVFGINHHLAFGGVIFGSTVIELARQASCDVLGVR